MAGKFRSKANFDKMELEAKIDQNGGKVVDERLWSISNRSQTKVYTMRLIPYFSKVMDSLNGYRKILKHNVKYTDSAGKEKSIGAICPKTWDPNAICPYCNVIGVDKKINWDDKEQKDFYKMFFAKPSYISNIFMIDDQNDKINNDKIWLYNFCKQAFTPVLDQIAPTEVMKKKRTFKKFSPYGYETMDYDLTFNDPSSTDNGYPSYSDSEFIKDTLGVYKGKDDEQDKLIESAYDLDEYIDVLKSKYNYSTAEEYMHSRIGNLLGVNKLQESEYGTDEDDDSIDDKVDDKVDEIEDEIDDIEDEIKKEEKNDEIEVKELPKDVSELEDIF
jgi:hypothetical protein